MQSYIVSIKDIRILPITKHYTVPIRVQKKKLTQTKGCVLAWDIKFELSGELAPTSVSTPNLNTDFLKSNSEITLETEFNPLLDFDSASFKKQLAFFETLRSILKKKIILLPLDLPYLPLLERLKWFVDNSLVNYCKRQGIAGNDFISPPPISDSMAWAIDSVLLLIYDRLFPREKQIEINDLLLERETKGLKKYFTRTLVDGKSNYIKIKIGSDSPVSVSEEIRFIQDVLTQFQQTKKNLGYGEETLLFIRFDVNQKWTLTQSIDFFKKLSFLLDDINGVFVDYVEEPLTSVSNLPKLLECFDDKTARVRKFDIALDESLLQGDFNSDDGFNLSHLPSLLPPEIIWINKPNFCGGLEKNIQLFLASFTSSSSSALPCSLSASLPYKRRFIVTSSFETSIGVSSLLAWIKLLQLENEIHGLSTHQFIKKIRYIGE